MFMKQEKFLPKNSKVKQTTLPTTGNKCVGESSEINNTSPYLSEVEQQMFDKLPDMATLNPMKPMEMRKVALFGDSGKQFQK